MQKLAFLLISGAVIACTMLACEDVTEPGEEASPPGIVLDFVPDASLDKVRINLAETDTLVKDLNEIFNEKKDNGEDTTAILEELNFFIAKSDSLDKLFNLFKSGAVKIDDFSAEGGNFIPAYQDTTNDEFEFPLNPNANSTTFYFNYHKLQDTITITYKLISQAGLEKITLSAIELDIQNHTFDSLSRHFCQGINCRSSEITYRVYF